MEQQAQPEGCFWSLTGCTVQLLSAVFTEAYLFSSSHRLLLGNGISGCYILFTGNPTGVFRMARCSAFRARSTGPPITVGKIISALFTNCLPGALGNGTGE